MTRTFLPATRPPTPGWWVQPVPPLWWWMMQPVPTPNAVLVLRVIGFIGVLAQAMLLIALGYEVAVVTGVTAAVAAAATAAGAGLTGGLLGQRAQ